MNLDTNFEPKPGFYGYIIDLNQGGVYVKENIRLTDFLFLFYVLYGPDHAQAQGAMGNPGDITIIAFNGDGDDDLALVLFRDAIAGTQIFITDDEWNGTAFNDANEGTLTWTNSTGSTIPAGTVLILTDIDSGSNPSFGANLGNLIMSDNTFNIAVDGDSIWVYMGSRITPSFLTAISTDNSGFSGITHGVLTNTGLTEGVDAIFFRFYC